MGDGSINGERLVEGIKAARRNIKPGDFAKVHSAISTLRSLPLAASFLDGILGEVLEQLGYGSPKERTSVYLAFFGLDDRAAYLKIGIAKSVRSRMGGIATGNPLPNLWTYELVLGSRQEALNIEAALLKHMSAYKVHGEWVNVAALSHQAAEAVVESLAEIASQEHGEQVRFNRARV